MEEWSLKLLNYGSQETESERNIQMCCKEYILCNEIIIA